MDRLPTRRNVLEAGIGCTALATAGCLGAADGDSETFNMASTWEIRSLDPVEGDMTLGQLGVYENLVGVDREMRVRPELATDWSVGDDEVTWTFELREDVEFHDGTAFDAEAAEFSLERAFDESSRLVGLPIASIDATGSYELEIVTDEPHSPLPAYLTLRDAAILSPEGVVDGTFEEVSCTGPFTFEEWEPEQSVTISRNEDYYGAAPSLETVVYERITDNQTRVLSLQNDEQDVCDLLPASAVDTLESDPDVTVDVYDVSAIRFLAFNVAREPFNDVRVRRAVAHAIDAEAIVNDVLEGVGRPATGPFSPSLTHWANEDLEPYAYDLDRAAELLEEAGWDRDGEGRSRDGEPFEVTLWTYTLRPELELLADVLQDQLSAVGIDASVRVTEWGALDSAKQSGEFDVSLESWSAFWWPDPDRLASFFHSEDTLIYTGYEDETTDELIERGRTVFDPDEREAVYDEFQERIHADLPAFTLTYSQYVTGYRNAVQGFVPNPSEYAHGLENVSIEE
ncbi:ABC transporter substrate-binding protein [Natrarchaeobius sp. A-rgal3]|uniref:ABC transporter substrate-binding protein n=1 Tax=Natrarchaeobius versutus TaxID=1679078 RepID=UPI0035106282